MAVLPTVQGRAIPNPVRPMASISRAAAAAPANALAQIGDQMLDQEAEAAARERDAAVSDRIRSLMYDPETGFMNLRGADAVSGRQRTIEELEKLKTSAFEGLSPNATRKLRSSVDRRLESAFNGIDGHTSDARRDWLEGAADARVASAYQDALTGQTDAALATIRAEVIGRADREGWSAEERNQKLGEATSKVYADQVTALASADPIRAMEYLRENQDSMLPSDVANIEARLMPEMKRAVGRQMGRAAYEGVPLYEHQTRVEYAMGSARPNRPDPLVVGVIGRSVEDVLGAGARVVVTSGKENEGHQHGSNRHGTGFAADVAIYRPDGTVVKATDPEAAAIARAAAGNGALGIGFGAEYMGGSHFHIDLVEPGEGQANTWASGGTAMRGEIVSLIDQRRTRGAQGLDGIVNHPDPMEREAALNEISLLTSIAEGQRKAEIEAAQDQAFRMIEGGGTIDDLSVLEKQSLGQTAMTSLRSYERSVRSKAPVETNPATYYQLRQMQATDPQGFRALNMMEYVDKLSQSDWQGMVSMQTKPASDVTTVAASTLMETAKRQLEAAGLDPTPEPGSRDSVKVASLQTRLLQWQDGFIAQNGKAPSPSEINERISRELLPIVINPTGFNDEFRGNLLTFSTGGVVTTGLTGSEQSGDWVTTELLAEAEIKIGDIDVPNSVVREQISQMRADGMEVTPEALSSRLLTLMGR